MRQLLAVLSLLFIVLAAGCSGEDGNGDSKGDHVWKEQTETLDKARQVEDVMQKQAEEQRRKVEDLD